MGGRGGVMCVSTCSPEGAYYSGQVPIFTSTFTGFSFLTTQHLNTHSKYSGNG